MTDRPNCRAADRPPLVGLPRYLLGIATMLLPLAVASEGAAIGWACPEANGGTTLCGQATCGDDTISTGDALVALKAAVGSAYCSACRCDTDSSGSVRATDAARILAAAVNQPVDLSCPPCNSLTITMESSGTKVDATAEDVASDAMGGVVAAWVEDGTVETRRFDSSLLPVGPARPMASSSDEMIRLHTCVGSDGSIAVAWESDPPRTFPPPHDYDDTGNVKAARLDETGDALGPLNLHPNVSGWQTPLGLFCLRSGEMTAVWRSSCIGLRQLSEGSFSSYSPQGCPLNGVWLQRFDAAGHPLDEPRLVVRTFSQHFLPWERAVALPNGRFVLASNNRLVITDANGNVQIDTTMSSRTHLRVQHDCSAGAHRCVSINDAHNLVAVLYDTADVETRIGLILRQTESTYDPPLDITIHATSPSLACDASGICVAAWHLRRVEEDFDSHYEESTNLGIFARAFNAHTGEVGPEVPISGTRIVATASGRFVLIEDGGDSGSVLRLVVVH